jgi:D-arabinose 1-dehydrogenase-like Zn-dependent alcohol dehydrogenase
VKQEQRLLTTALTNISKENKPTEGTHSVVVDEKFVLRIPENIDEAGAALYYVQESQLVTIKSLESKSRG